VSSVYVVHTKLILPLEVILFLIIVFKLSLDTYVSIYIYMVEEEKFFIFINKVTVVPRGSVRGRTISNFND
jgi:hypothetical protein